VASAIRFTAGTCSEFSMEPSIKNLGKDPASVTGYLRGGQDLRQKMERLILFFEGGGKNLNN
jgi:hypothetical protein